MKPWCYNREERAPAGRWVDTGRVSPAGTWRPVLRLRNVLGQEIKVALPLRARQILRWRPSFDDVNACHAYDEPAGTMSTAERRGYECAGCRWLPEHAR